MLTAGGGWYVLSGCGSSQLHQWEWGRRNYRVTGCCCWYLPVPDTVSLRIPHVVSLNFAAYHGRIVVNFVVDS